MASMPTPTEVRRHLVSCVGPYLRELPRKGERGGRDWQGRSRQPRRSRGTIASYRPASYPRALPISEEVPTLSRHVSSPVWQGHSQPPSAADRRSVAYDDLSLPPMLP